MSCKRKPLFSLGKAIFPYLQSSDSNFAAKWISSVGGAMLQNKKSRFLNTHNKRNYIWTSFIRTFFICSTLFFIKINFPSIAIIMSVQWKITRLESSSSKQLRIAHVDRSSVSEEESKEESLVRSKGRS